MGCALLRRAGWDVFSSTPCFPGGFFLLHICEVHLPPPRSPPLVRGRGFPHRYVMKKRRPPSSRSKKMSHPVLRTITRWTFSPTNSSEKPKKGPWEKGREFPRGLSRVCGYDAFVFLVLRLGSSGGLLTRYSRCLVLPSSSQSPRLFSLAQDVSCKHVTVVEAKSPTSPIYHLAAYNCI